jgi:uncharacterized protein
MPHSSESFSSRSTAIAPHRFSIQPRRPYNPQQLRPRSVQFHFSEDIPRLWLGGNPVKTHFVNGINLFIGEFESFVVDKLRSHLLTVHDPILRGQIVGFLGQELSHSHVHTAYNQTLQNQGYRFTSYAKFSHFFFRKLLNGLGPIVNLAIIAGFEQMTAALSEVVLESNFLEQAHPTLKSLWEWHAAEELEHQAIAFNYLQICNRSYGLRCLGAVLGLAIVLGFSLSGMAILLVQEQGWWRWKTLEQAVDLFFTGDRLAPRCFQRFFPYFNPHFHPTHSQAAYLSRQVLG